MSACIEPFVGKILASWRYDISGLAPEMSGDYQAHLERCAHCRSRQRLHRTIDLTLIALATLAVAASLVVFVLIRHYHWRHAFFYEIGSLGVLALSALVWLLVAIATPAPIVVKAAVKGPVKDAVLDAARSGARSIHNRLPENLRGRIPEELRSRISGEGEKDKEGEKKN